MSLFHVSFTIQCPELSSSVGTVSALLPCIERKIKVVWLAQSKVTQLHLNLHMKKTHEMALLSVLSLCESVCCSSACTNCALSLDDAGSSGVEIENDIFKGCCCPSKVLDLWRAWNWWASPRTDWSSVFPEVSKHNVFLLSFLALV